MTRYARRDASGFAFDVHDAPDAAAVRSRLGLPDDTVFYAVPSDTRCGAAMTVVGEAVTQSVNPTPPTPPVVYREINRFEFWNLLTTSEKALVIVARDDPEDPTIRVWWEDYKASPVFLRDHPSVSLGLAVLNAKGCITSERLASILADWPTA